MKLVDLNPRWATDQHGHRIGFSFTCPACLGAPAKDANGYDLCGGRVYVGFANPLDGASPDPHGWQRTGETFDALTISPSIFLNPPGAHHRPGCSWHGWVRNGEVTTA